MDERSRVADVKLAGIDRHDFGTSKASNLALKGFDGIHEQWTPFLAFHVSREMVSNKFCDHCKGILIIAI